MKRIEYFTCIRECTRETRVDRDLQRSKEEVDSSWVGGFKVRWRTLARFKRARFAL